MDFFLETNPAFLILPIEDKEYIFYNSLQHRGSRLTHLEMLILDMYYRYQNKDFIVSNFENNKQDTIRKALEAIDHHHLLLCEEIKEPELDTDIHPTSFYIHPTYKCNLNCGYCYNKTIRKAHGDTIGLTDWMAIIDKLSPYAKTFTLTGGEFFLYPDIVLLVKYIRKKCPDSYIGAISNGMHNFQTSPVNEIFDYISGISFSCDSISREGERKGFNPKLYVDNIKWIKRSYPKLKISISSTVTSSNSKDIDETDYFCKKNDCNFSKFILIPQSVDEIDLMPDFNEMIEKGTVLTNKTKRLDTASFTCGAGRNVWSIDPMGNVYPCQSLHHGEFLMGNILRDSVEDMKYSCKNGRLLKTVNDFAVCSRCKVKYICGGGCPAPAYNLYDGKIDRNHLTCYMDYTNSIRKLKSLDNRL